jgi:hypothetical protein
VSVVITVAPTGPIASKADNPAGLAAALDRSVASVEETAALLRLPPR